MQTVMDTPEKTGADAKAPKPRFRLIIDITDDIVRRAVDRRAKKDSLESGDDVSNSDVVERILRDALGEEISELQRLDKGGGPKKRKK